MKLPWRTRQQEPAMLDLAYETPQPRSETHRSPGLKAVFAEMPRDGSCRVLDLGPAIAGNLDFISTFASRIQIADFRAGGDPISTVPNPDLERWMQALRDLAASAGGSFDLVLAWDVVAYLPSHRIDDLVAVLAELCRPDARLYAIVPTSGTMPAMPNRYRIVDDENLVYESVTGDLRGAPEMSPNTVGRLLEGFEIEHSFVLRHGVREYVATRNV